ncbi:MAG: hypothetical protein ACOYNL_09260 [Rickettsiales bacterium]
MNESSQVTMEFELDEESVGIVEKMLATGRYGSTASEVVIAALELWLGDRSSRLPGNAG